VSFRTRCFATFSLAATAASVAVVIATILGGVRAALAVGLLVPVAAGAAGWLEGNRLRKSLQALQGVLTAGNQATLAKTGLAELDEFATKLEEFAQRLSDFSASVQEELREFATLAAGMDRRTPGSGRQPRVTPDQLRRLLTGITQAVDTELVQVWNQLADVESCTRDITSEAEDQHDAVSKTVSYVEQLSANIDAIIQHTQATAGEATDVYAAADQLVAVSEQLTGGMDNMRNTARDGERKLRALSDRARDVSALVAAISDISSRTDLLALNASIESVRAGENGKGFAIVAEEVRKLAEQTAQAIREIAGLVDLTDKDLHDSISLLADQRGRTEEYLTQIVQAGTAVQQIRELSEATGIRSRDVEAAVQRQLELTRDVVLTMEGIAHRVKQSRRRADKANWTVRALTRAAKTVDEELSWIRGGAVGERRKMLGDLLRTGKEDSEEKTIGQPMADAPAQVASYAEVG
jgi:methyl-accepting chemotaxis protein